MTEEQFFQMFLDRLRESVGKLTPLELQSSPFKNSYLSKWNPCEDSAQPSGAIVACDGSIGESSFSGGLVVLIARAIAHIYTPEGGLKSIMEVDTEANYKLQGRSLFMKTLELRVLRKALEKTLQEHEAVLGIFDGSLYLTFLHHREHLRRVAWVFEKYVRELASLLKLTGKNTVIIGLSKDSDINYLRAKIMLDVVKSLSTELMAEVKRGRSIKRIRERLAGKAEFEPKGSMLRTCIEELEKDLSDEGVYGELAPNPGFTTPLLLAPQTLFLTGESKARSWWDTGFRGLLENDVALKGILEALDEYFSTTPIALSYWRPAGMLGVYRLDVSSSLLGCEGSCGDLSDDKFMDDEAALKRMRGIISFLNWMKQGPHVVYPLVEVDTIARLDRTLYKNAYEPVIVDELKRRGFKVSPRRRSIRDMVLRGY
ncbi:MAG: DNA double-strand break repair nuclease NurA [Thermoproteota archaeon]